MPRRNATEKARARAIARRWPVNVERFFSVLNDGRATFGATQFDADLHASHQRVRESLLQIAEIMRLKALHGWDQAVDVSPIFERLFKTSTFEDLPPEIDAVRQAREHTLAFSQALTLTFYLDFQANAPGQRVAAYRCVARCQDDACKRWFFAMDDRQTHCTPRCRPSRSITRKL